MIEQITDAYTANAQSIRLDQLVNQLVEIPPNPSADVNRYLEAEEKIHHSFEAFVAGRGIVATRRYDASMSDRQWQVEAYAPIPLSGEDTTRPLQAIPFRESNVIRHEWQATPYECGMAYRTVPAPERFEERAIGFYISSLPVAVVMRQRRVVEPWAGDLSSPRLGVARRHTPRLLRQAGVVVTPNLEEGQRRFSELVADIEQLAAKDIAEVQAS